jgi:hypothetical protein
MRLAVALTTLVLATSSAMAQPAMTSPGPAASHGEEVDPSVALALSLGGTVASYGLIGAAIGARSGTLGNIGLVGVLVAPSFGHFYVGKYATRGMLLRGLGIVTFIVGALADSEGCSLFYSGHGDPEPEDCGEDFRTPKGTAIMIAGMAMFAGGTIDDIVTAPGRARRHNERIRALAVSVTPIVRQDGGGLALVGRF